MSLRVAFGEDYKTSQAAAKAGNDISVKHGAIVCCATSFSTNTSSSHTPSDAPHTLLVACILLGQLQDGRLSRTIFSIFPFHIDTGVHGPGATGQERKRQ